MALCRGTHMQIQLPKLSSFTHVIQLHTLFSDSSLSSVYVKMLSHFCLRRAVEGSTLIIWIHRKYIYFLMKYSTLFRVHIFQGTRTSSGINIIQLSFKILEKFLHHSSFSRECQEMHPRPFKRFGFATKWFTLCCDVYIRVTYWFHWTTTTTVFTSKFVATTWKRIAL